MEFTREKFPNNIQVDDTEAVELLKCKYSVKKKGSKLYSKLIRQNDETGEYLVKKSKITSHELMETYRSFRFVEETLTGLQIDWYNDWLYN